MDLKPIEISHQSVMRQITMHVRVVGMTSWRIRQWIGLRLLKLSARVMGCNIEIESSKDRR